MADPQIGGVLVPDDMKNKGVWLYAPQVTGIRNGEHVMVSGRYARATWTFNVLDRDQWDWWVTTLLAGERSLALTGVTVLWDDTYDPDNMLTFDYCVVDRPLVGAYENGLYKNVTVSFTGLKES